MVAYRGEEITKTCEKLVESARVGSITLIQFNYNYSLKYFNYITITPCKKYQITVTTYWFVFTFSLAQKLLDCT